MTTPTIRRIQTETGSRLEPPLDQGWSNLNKLRWSLAVVLYDGGLPPDLLRVEPGRLRVNGVPVESYDLVYPGGCYGGGGFREMWSLLNGISIGLRIGKENPARG